MRRFLFWCALFTAFFQANAEKLEYKYVNGDKFRVLSTVSEDVTLDGRYAYTAEIFNRIAFSISDSRPDGSGLISGTFETSEREKGSNASYVLSRHYDSAFRRDRSGVYDIEEKYFMPVVRNIPVFPDRDLKAGDTWVYAGEERHDFRDSYGIPEPYRIPFEARYRYLGPKTVDGKTLHEVAISYTVFHLPPRPRAFKTTYPVRIMGSSDQTVLFDNVLGMPVSYRERFRIIIDLATGRAMEFSGTAESRVLEAELMDRTKVADDVRKSVEDLKLDSVNVRKSDDGVVISLENIQFLADSAVLQDSEKRKIALIAGILKNYPGRDILVGGHTALAGTEGARMKLSIDRARAVADQIIGSGARKPEEVTVRGYGAANPVADNLTEAGMKKNRRVEITILEN